MLVFHRRVHDGFELHRAESLSLHGIVQPVVETFWDVRRRQLRQRGRLHDVVRVRGALGDLGRDVIFVQLCGVGLPGFHHGGVRDGAVRDTPRDGRLFLLLHLRAFALRLPLHDELMFHHLPPTERLHLHRQGPLHHLLGQQSVRLVALAVGRRLRRGVGREELHPGALLSVPDGLQPHSLEIIHLARECIASPRPSQSEPPTPSDVYS